MVVFDKPFQYKHVVKDGEILPQGDKVEAGHTGAFIGFATRKGEKGNCKSGIFLYQPRTSLAKPERVGGKRF